MNVNPRHQKKLLRALKKYYEILPDLIYTGMIHDVKTYTIEDLYRTDKEVTKVYYPGKYYNILNNFMTKYFTNIY